MMLGETNELIPVVEEPCIQVFLPDIYQQTSAEDEYEQRYLDSIALRPTKVEPTKQTKADIFAEKFGHFFYKVSGDDEEINAYELQLVMKLIFKQHFPRKENFSLEACRSMISMMDADRSGSLSYNQFKKLWMKIMEWKKCFEKSDDDNSVTIDREELESAMKALKFQLSDDTLDTLVARYVNKKGSINLDDFIQVCARVTSMTTAYQDLVGRDDDDDILEDMMLLSLYN